MLTGKTAVVTGGSRGIGAAIVRKLASQGANVARNCAPSARRSFREKPWPTAATWRILLR